MQVSCERHKGVPLTGPLSRALLTPRDVGRRYGLTRKMVMGLIRRGTLRSLKDGGRYKVRLEDAEELLGRPAGTEPDTCARCEEEKSRRRHLERENLSLIMEVRKYEQEAVALRNAARTLAEAIRRGCTDTEEVQPLIEEFSGRRHGS